MCELLSFFLAYEKVLNWLEHHCCSIAAHGDVVTVPETGDFDTLFARTLENLVLYSSPHSVIFKALLRALCTTGRLQSTCIRQMLEVLLLSVGLRVFRHAGRMADYSSSDDKRFELVEAALKAITLSRGSSVTGELFLHTRGAAASNTRYNPHEREGHPGEVHNHMTFVQALDALLFDAPASSSASDPWN